MTIGSQRACFQLLGGLTASDPSSSPGSPGNVRAFVLNFGGEATGIVPVSVGGGFPADPSVSAPWHTLDGAASPPSPSGAASASSAERRSA